MQTHTASETEMDHIYREVGLPIPDERSNLPWRSSWLGKGKWLVSRPIAKKGTPTAIFISGWDVCLHLSSRETPFLLQEGSPHAPPSV